MFKESYLTLFSRSVFARGRAYYELKDKAKAKADLEKAMDLVPTYAEAQRWLEAVNKMQ